MKQAFASHEARGGEMQQPVLRLEWDIDFDFVLGLLPRAFAWKLARPGGMGWRVLIQCHQRTMLARQTVLAVEGDLRV